MSLTERVEGMPKKRRKLNKEMEKMRNDLEKLSPAIRDIEATMRKREEQGVGIVSWIVL